MATTSPSDRISLTSVALATTGVLASAAIAYAVYFDHRRRSDPEFRRSLKRQQKKISKQNEESAQAADRAQKERIQRLVQEANEEGFERDPEKTEQYFMQEVAKGEAMCGDGSDPVDAALCFYRALKVYPQPGELVSIYDKTVPKVSLSSSNGRGCHWNGSLITVSSAHSRCSRRNDRRRPNHFRLLNRIAGWLG